MTQLLVALALGLVTAAFGGEVFLRGLVGAARRFRIPPGIIGATVAAFATSSPEASVAVSASLAGVPRLALGDSLGSNVVNVGLILGVALVFRPLQASLSGMRRDLLAAILAPVITFLLALDGEITRSDAILMLTFFLVWLGMAVLDARRATAEALGQLDPVWRVAAFSLFGLGLLVLAGKLVVYSAKGFTAAYSLDPFVVGAILVAIGTSLPELATVVMSRLRGYDDIGLGAVLGSNVFNNLFIVSLAALVEPIPVRWEEIGITLFFGTLLVVLMIPGRSLLLSRRRGVILLLVYAMYVAGFLVNGRA